MVNARVLSRPDFHNQFVLETDTSGHDLGALLQNQLPVAFFSHTLLPQARLKSIYEKELMPIVLAVQKWHHYLLGRRLLIHTDQRSVKIYHGATGCRSGVPKWFGKLMGFHFDIQYNPGASNQLADSLTKFHDSRRIWGH